MVGFGFSLGISDIIPPIRNEEELPPDDGDNGGDDTPPDDGDNGDNPEQF